MNNRTFNIKDLIDRDLDTRKNALYNLVLFTGPLKKDELIKFYQISNKKYQKYCFWFPLALLNKEKKLSSTKETVLPYLPKLLFESTSKLSFVKCLKFLEYLIQLKDNKGRFVYYKSIDNIYRLDRYPDVILCEIDNVLYYIQYCPSSQINEYNEYINARDEATNTTDNNIRRILVSDDGLKPDDVKVNGISNVVTIDQDDNIRVIR